MFSFGRVCCRLKEAKGAVMILVGPGCAGVVGIQYTIWDRNGKIGNYFTGWGRWVSGDGRAA